MDENGKKQEELLATTDSLEAIGVFKGMKNFLFVIIVICLLLLQVSFWVVHRNLAKPDDQGETVDKVSLIKPRIAVGPVISLAASTETKAADTASATEKDIAVAAKEATKELTGKDEAEPQEQPGRIFQIKFTYIAGLVRFCDYLLILAATLYCLTMLFSLKISLLARLGGINHISRAFFLSLIMLVILLPWQRLFDGVIVGAIYTPAELLKCSSYCGESSSIFCKILFYLRFVGLWVIEMLLVIFAQIRSVRWAKATLRRLEIV